MQRKQKGCALWQMSTVLQESLLCRGCSTPGPCRHASPDARMPGRHTRIAAGNVLPKVGGRVTGEQGMGTGIGGAVQVGQTRGRKEADLDCQRTTVR